MPNRQYLRRARRTPRNFTRMLLPHERDERADGTRAEAEPQHVMKQAERDLAAGQEDTDCRSQPPGAAAGKTSPAAEKKE
ncbi:hypothetical protein BWI17_04075 [Betaproteobacteria bacterium GR16-43]|nr:hypothetical protein BWI17_04075 [Betaproteobacteria bacterium GR16-43]